MDKRRLLGTDLDVSTICYGPMRAPTSPHDPLLDQHRRALYAALDHGVNFIHSSYEYGVRWMMNSVLRDHPARSDLLHVIKVPVPDWDDSSFDPSKFESRIDEALDELCTDRIALVQWMWRCRPHEEGARLKRLAAVHDDAAACFSRLRDKGKVGHMACFPYFPDSAHAAMAHPAEQALIAYYNPIEMEMSPLIGDLAAKGRGFLAIRPLYEGVLTDRFSQLSDVPAGHRLAHPKYAPAFARRAAIARSVPLAAQSMTRFAIRFPLFNASCASVVVGLSSTEQVQQICTMANDTQPDPETVARVLALNTQP